MTVVRGQIYQFNLNPLVFFSIQRIYSVNQILIMNVDNHSQTYFTEARLLSSCTLVPSVPENRIHNVYDQVLGKGGVSLAYGLTHPFLSARVQSRHATLAKAHAPTYLRGRLTHANMAVEAQAINPLVLGGNLASQWRVVQAQADQG